ncbi:MAG: hypothetical protein NT004_08550 [Bacteroidetes bacterium]|nr:hypothetical protein [Bacteroidota bacterium]
MRRLNVKDISEPGMISFQNFPRTLIIITGILISLALPNHDLHAQVAGFLSPDTVCAGEAITVTNTTAGGSAYYWNFCSGNANQNPTGTNIGNPGNLLDIPTYLTLVQSGTNYWSFVSCQGVGVIRYYHGNSFKNNPISWTNLGTFGGTITFSQEGIQVKEDNGLWYGFVCSNTKLVRLNFSNSPGNTPTATSLNFSGLNMLHGLVIIKEGVTWLGFATCSTGNKMVRFNFGTSLANTPVMTDFGNFAGFNTPAALCIVQENSLWYGLVMAGNNTISRITFGTSLLNTPTGVNLGNPGGLNSAGGLTLLRDCESTTGYYVNYLSPGQLGKLTFPTGITGTVSGQVLGNIGNLAQPHSFSELFRQNDTLFAYITNRQNGTLTRLTFPPCSNASVPSSTLFNPPSFSYNTAGTYNVRLIVNEGLPTQSSVCKSIVVLAAPCNTVASFTAPDTVCVGEPISLTNQSTTGGTYYWSFCSGSALANPLGQNIGNPGNLLNIPAYSTLVKDGNTCYSFITNHGSMSVVRYNHGASFSNNPVSWTNLGGFGYLSDTVMGIKVNNDNGSWIGIVLNSNRMVRLNFGTSLANTPTATLLGPYTMMFSAHCLDIIKEGTTWIGFVTCTNTGNKLIRLNFGNSLLNPPVLTDLGLPGSMNQPASFRIINENGIWYGLVANFGNNTMTRLTFGNSLLNDPTGVNLGVVCPSINPGGITLIRDCEGTSGFQLNYSTTSTDLLWRLTFPTGITGTISGSPLGNIGAMSRPNTFSELFRVGDTLFVYVLNRMNFTITRLRFLPCSNASVPSSILFTPPNFSYNQPGTYNVQLIVNEGLPTQASVCKSIVVLAAPCIATAAFTAPDTVCVGEPVSITNQSTGGGSYYWNFCSGNAASTPVGFNMGTLGGALNGPVYSSLVKEGPDCFTFITNQGAPTHITRIYHGNSFRNAPVSIVSILQTGILDHYVEALQIINDNGTWYGLVCNNSTVLRLNFGASLWNVNPTVTDLGPFTGLIVAHGISIVKEGATWLAFFNSSSVNKLYRLNFGTSLANTPVFTDFGNIAVFAHPVQIAAIKENGLCYLFMNNYSNNTLSRISFGNSYLNAPTGQNLGNCGGLDKPHGISLLNDCETSTGYYTTYRTSPLGAIGRLNFSGGVGGTVTSQSLGNLGNLDNPCSFSELFRENDSLFSFVLNQYNSTMTRFSFPPCSNASVPSSTLYNPPIYTYSQPGTYNVRLIVNEGLFTQASLCKSITVMAAPIVSLGTDRSICPGTTTILDAGIGFTSYLWSTGATSQMIAVGNAGSYWVKVTNYGCIDYDTVSVSLYPVAPVNLGADATVCEGQTVTFNAGYCFGCSYIWSNLTTGDPNIGIGSTYTTGVPGIYSVNVTSLDGCINSDTIQLSLIAAPVFSINPSAQTICSGNKTSISLSSSSPVTTFSWIATLASGNITGFSAGFDDTIRQLLTNHEFTAGSVIYSITAEISGCFSPAVACTVIVHPIPDVSFSPSSMTICTGGSFQIQLNSQAQPAAFSWEATGSSGFITNYSGGTGTSIGQSPQNTGHDPETVIYTVTPESNGCSGIAVPFIATVNPSPTLIVSSYPAAMCSEDTIEVHFSSPTVGASFSWTASASSPVVAGYSSGTGNSFTQTLENPGSTGETVTYIVTPQANGCNGSAFTMEVFVKPNPDVIVSPVSQSVCFGQQTHVSLSSSFQGIICSWTATGSSTAVTGYSNGSGIQINQTLFTTGTTTQTVTYFIKSTLDGCNSQISEANALTYPLPDMTINPPGQTICSGEFTGISLASQLSGATFEWNANGSAGITGYSGGSGSSIAQILHNSSNTAGFAIYTVTPSVANCSGAISAVTVNVSPKPSVTFTVCNDSITTTSAKPFRLRGGLPRGGTYSGPGVENDTALFDPSASGIGIHQIIYFYSNAYNCPASAAGLIRVLPNPVFTCKNTLTDVRDGHEYSTFRLPNGRCWMQENLDFGFQISDLSPQTDNCIAEYYRNPNSTISNPQSFYQWDELMDYSPIPGSKGLCPPGWHIPTSSEWMELLDFNIGQSQAAGPLKDLWLENGFQAIPEGLNYLDRLWVFAEIPLKGTFFWTSTPAGSSDAFARGVNSANASVSLYSASRANAFSVRCVKD